MRCYFFEAVKDLHQRDLEQAYAGVFLVNALEKKYKNAAKEFIWQWFFPAKQLTYLQKKEEYRPPSSIMPSRVLRTLGPPNSQSGKSAPR
jgi:hypothetical protein